MDLELRDKVAIVGGASKGLGRACAEVLAQEGAQVAICSRSKDDLEKAASEIRAATGREVLVFAGDLDRPETIRDLVAATVARFGRLDVLDRAIDENARPLDSRQRSQPIALAPDEDDRLKWFARHEKTGYTALTSAAVCSAARR